MIFEEIDRVEWILMHKETAELAVGFPVYSHFHKNMNNVYYFLAGWAFINRHDCAFLFTGDAIDENFIILGEL